MRGQTETATVHQCLHGYADGHELIESSTKLSPEADHVLLTMSDMSGPTMITGYQSYLTGYPVPGSNWYAFAKTWYADEMRRPGCVWTHTLLIDTADLALASDMKTLRKLFVRPEKDHKQYRKSLSFLLEQRESFKRRKYSAEQASAVISALYQAPEQPVFMTSQNPDEYSELILELWTQQHAKLRRAFLFSTGSLSTRRLKGRVFDLQIVPPALVRQVQRETPDAHFVEGRSAPSSDAPVWLDVAVDDLLHRHDEQLRSFLMFFGADAREGRAGFSELLALFTRLTHPNKKTAVSDILSILSEYYPDPEQGLLLKQSLLGGVANKLPFLPVFPESQLFFGLATTQSYRAFQNESLKLQGRAAKFAEEPTRLKKLLVRFIDKSLNPVGEEIIKGIALGIRSQDLVELARERTGLLIAFSKYNPELLATSQFWQQPADNQRELYDLVVPLLRENIVDLNRLLDAMLDGGSDVLAPEITRQFGFEAVTAVLSWVEKNSKQLPSGWLWNLSYRTDDLVRWLRNAQNPQISTLAVLANTLDPHSAQVIGLGTKPWQQLPSHLGESRDSPSIRIWSFLLSLGFNNPTGDAQSLTAESFQAVHDFAERDELPYQSWRLLMHQAPSLSWWGEWDKCKRLRHALVDYFIRNDWDPHVFATAVKRPDTLREIYDDYSVKSAGGRFLRKVASEVTKRKVAVDEDILRTFAEFH